MPCTRSMVVSMVKSGTICTRPPMETVISVSTAIRMTLRSMTPWSRRKRNILCGPPLLGRGDGGRAQRGGARRRHLAGDAVAHHRHPEVVDHDEGSTQVQQAAQHPDDVVGVHRGDGLDEAVLQEAVLVVGAPHQ